MHNGNKPLLILIPLLLMKKMRVIGKGQELHQTSLFPTMRSITINVGTRARLLKAWETTL